MQDSLIKLGRQKELSKANYNQKQLTPNCDNITELREIKIPALKKGERWREGLKMYNLKRELCNDLFK